TSRCCTECGNRTIDRSPSRIRSPIRAPVPGDRLPSGTAAKLVEREMISQLGQDLLVLELLDGLRDGFFLDSGAANGTDSSNTLLLEAEYGWSGICIEPDPQLYQQLVRVRRCT